MQFSAGEPVHTIAKDADGFGDVVGQDVGHQQADDDNERQDNEFVPNRGKRQAWDKQRTGQAFGLLIVPVADEKQIFFAETAVFDARQIRIRIVDGECAGAFDGLFVDVAVEDVFIVIVEDNEHGIGNRIVFPFVEDFARTAVSA